MFSHLFKSVVGAALVVSASLALALPTPKDIEAAVAAQHYSQAESMLREVLVEKPQSAKAHYELGQVLAHETRYKEAHSELEKAKDIDPSLKFATSVEKFNLVFSKVGELAAAPTSSVVMQPTQSSSIHGVAPELHQSSAGGDGFSLSYVWIAIAGLVVLGLWLRRSAAANASSAQYVPANSTSTGLPAQRGFGAQFVQNSPQTAYAPQGYAQPGSGGSTMTGAVVGGLAGVAAGYALSKALEGDHHATPSSIGMTPADNGGYVPFEAPVQQPDLGSFDAGSGSDWDGADSGGSSSDDSW